MFYRNQLACLFIDYLINRRKIRNDDSADLAIQEFESRKNAIKRM